MRRIAALMVFSVTFPALAYAAKKYPLTASTIVPASRGQAQVGTDKNGNTKVKISVEHLATPASLSPAKNSYVIWFQEPGGNPESQGVLKVDKKNLKGNFETTTPWKSFAILITAEDDASPKAPTGPEVLKATVQP